MKRLPFKGVNAQSNSAGHQKVDSGPLNAYVNTKWIGRRRIKYNQNKLV